MSEGNEHRVVALLAERGLTLATAESTVGGMIGHLLTNVPGASRVFVGGVTAYGNRPKADVLGVARDLMREHGAVSEPTVAAMAHGARRLMGTDIAVAESGIASPTGNPDRPGGLYVIGIVAEGVERVARYRFDGDRESTKAQATAEALRLVIEHVEGTS